MSRPTPRKWYPKNPEKYMGDIKNIVARSSWEIKTLNWLDSNQNVLYYSSEEIAIPYFSPVDNRMHRYFPDFLARMKTKDGTIKTYLIEVKPSKERFLPTTKNKKQFLLEMCTYTVNQAKWAAAEAFCKIKNICFIVIDEYDLSIKKSPKQ